MGPRADLDWCGKSRPTGIGSPGRPARRQSLYRLRYPDHTCLSNFLVFFRFYEPFVSREPEFDLIFLQFHESWKLFL